MHIVLWCLLTFLLQGKNEQKLYLGEILQEPVPSPTGRLLKIVQFQNILPK